MKIEKEKPDLEQLLSTLIQRGWKPFNKGGLNLVKLSGVHQGWLLLHEPSTRVAANYSLRDLTSRESNLWQFVCENGMLDADYDYEGWALVDAEDGCISEHETGCREIQTNTDWSYRLIESAFKDESELEDFLLNSIKLD